MNSEWNLTFLLFIRRDVMRKIGLLVVSMFCFALVSSTDIDYSTMSATELNEALRLAVIRNSADEVKKLVEAGADRNQKITYTENRYDDYDILTTTLLGEAARCGYVGVVKELKEKAKNEDINEAFILAAAKGRLEVVRELIQAKPKKSVISEALISAATNNHPDVVGELITAGANVNHFDKYKRTALILAAREGCLSIVKVLIKAGANVNHGDKDGGTALVLAAESGYPAVVRELIKAKSKQNAIDEALLRLIACESDRKTEAWKKSRAEAVQDLLKAKANVNHADKNGNTALMFAAKNHDLDAVQLLLKTRGIDVNRANNDGNTALIVALNCVRTSYIPDHYGRERKQCEDSQEIVKILFEAPGTNHHHVNKKGDTAVKLLERITSRL